MNDRLKQYDPVIHKVAQMTGTKPYLVGGAVRDALLGKESKDIDLTVVGGHENMVNSGWEPTGKSFPVFRHREMPGVEVAVARGEKKTGTGHGGFEWFPAKKLDQDLERRDFTMNAMAYHPDEGIVDPFGGQRDLSRGLIKHVSDAFDEDPLRVFRGARFASKLGFNVHPETLHKMRNMGGELSSLSKERVRDEFVRGLNTSHPEKFFHALKDSNTLKQWFPEVDNLIGVPAGNPAHHPEGDTFNHTMHALRYTADKGHDELTRMFALAHDLGKPDTPKEQWPKHHGHEDRTENATNMLNRFGFNQGIVKSVEGHIRHHLHPNYENMRPGTVVDYWKAMRRTREPHFGAYLADINAKGSRDYRDSPRVHQLRDIFGTLDKTIIEPRMNVTAIRQRFTDAAREAMRRR